MKAYTVGLAALIASWVLLFIGIFEGPQQGYVLFAMLVMMGGAVGSFAVGWLRGR